MVIGICMCRDEADIIGAVVSRMKLQVDHVIMSDNMSVDGTREILEDLDVELHIDKNMKYHHGREMTRLAAVAREQGASWVVPFDADEVWYSPHGRIADVLENVDNMYNFARAALFSHESTTEDDMSLGPIERMGWRSLSASVLPKVAVRAVGPFRIGVGNHEVFFRDVMGRPIDTELEIRHFAYRSVDQFVRKISQGYRALMASDAPPTVGTHWRRLGEIYDKSGEQGLRETFERECLCVNPSNNPALTYDPCPNAWHLNLNL